MELFAGYSYMRLHSSPSAHVNGWEVAEQYNSRAGLVRWRILMGTTDRLMVSAYLMTRFGGRAQNNLRVSTEILIRF